MTSKELIEIGDLYNKKRLKQALSHCGDYVYAYYEREKLEPFYIGLGAKERVLAHWKNAIANPQKRHEKHIRSLLDSGRYPLIRLLAYNLENFDPSKEKANALVERVLIETFGIDDTERSKFDGTKRLENYVPTLLQEKNENKKTPPLSLEAVMCQVETDDVYTKELLQQWCDYHNTAILLVGLSATYKPSYIQTELAEMARMYWRLDRFKNTTLPKFESADKICLLGWSSKANLTSKVPYLVGAWSSQGCDVHKKTGNNGNNYFLTVEEDISLKQQFIGARLSGTGNNWEGPHIYIPQ